MLSAMGRVLRTVLLSVCLLVLSASPNVLAQQSPARGPIGSGTGLVAASHPLAAEAGAQMLRRGGNAIDAAAATQFALNVVEPQFSGIGGGGFMLVYLAASGRTFMLDAREMAPAASTPDQFLGADGRPLPFSQAHVQGTAVGVPGTLLNVATALQRYGTVPLAEAIAPAIQLAERGFEINKFLAADIAGSADKLASWPATAAVFLPNGQPLSEGAALRQPDLAKSLRLIRDAGPDVLYHGELGRALIAAQAQRSGRMTLADLAAYEVKEREPVVGTFHEYTIMSASPPSSGGLTMQQMLQLLEPLNLRSSGLNTPRTMHLMLEAMHLAYADRGRYMGDIDFVPMPMRGLLDLNYVASRRTLIDPEVANPTPQAGDPFAYEGADRPALANTSGEDGQYTTHFTVVDGDGNIVAYTTTIEQGWGTGMIVPGYGFLLNNELTDFDFTPGGPNEVRPLGRPRSSMNPTIVFQDRQPILALGSPGGATIITTVEEVVLNVLEHRLSLQSAIDAPRFNSPSTSNFSWEAGIDPQTLDALRDLGHRPADYPTTIGSVQAAIRLPDGSWQGGADSRREGTVVYVLSVAK